MSEHPHDTSSDERYRAGDLIEGKYRLVRRIGQGGFGRVWVAHNSVLDVHVALKIIYMDPQSPPGSGTRLLEEARAAAQIGHSAIVRVFDFGKTERGDPFVAMELLHGESLAQRLCNDYRLPPVEAVQLLLPIADALAAVHARGIVHRDIKPENIHVSRDGSGRVQPKLLDFGVARRIDRDHRLTGQGMVIGTPGYMSPEQARGQRDVDQRTDIWSFSIVLYELVTGRVPFENENYNALLCDILEKPIAPITELLAGDADLWRVLQKGLEKDPSKRWTSIRAMGEALALWLEGNGISQDVCSASVRGTWLDITGSDRASGTRSSDAPEPVVANSARRSSPELETQGARRRRRLPALALGLGAASLLGFVATTHALRGQGTANAATAAPAAAPQVVVRPALPAPIAEAPAPAPAPAAREPEPEEPTARVRPASSKPAARTQSTAAPSKSAAPTTPPAASPPITPPPRRIDFGF